MPYAVIFSQASAALAGFVLIVLLVLSAGSIEQKQTSSNALVTILSGAIGAQGTAALGIVVLISIFACAVASMATATRLLFSMARDNIFPFSAYLAQINSTRRTPQIATLVIWAFSALVILAFRRIEIITSVGAVAAYLGYAGIMLATLITSKKLDSENSFSLGRWRPVIQVVALLWTLVVVSALSIPETEMVGIRSRHLPALMAILFGIFGGLLYFLYVRKKIKQGLAGPPVKP